MSGPLEGIKVIEAAEFVAMPAATAILADWGAEVVKVENTKGGDSFRGITAFGGVALKDKHIWFEQTNRNKKSIALDLWQEEGQAVLFKLIEKADMFVTNFTLPVIDRFNLDYDHISKINPKIVYGSLTGYGKDGPEKDKPGYDFAAFWAKSGIMSRIGEPGTAPPPQRGALGDNLTAGFIAGALSAALYQAEKTGQGQAVDFSLYHYGVWGLGMDIMVALNQDEELPRTDRKKAPNPLWNAYQTKDEAWIQLVCLQSERYWPQFCKALNIEHLENEPKFNTHEQRDQNCIELIAILDERFSSLTYEEVADRFDAAGEIIYGRVHNPLELVHDAQAEANDFFSTLDHPDGGQITFITAPAQFRKTPATIQAVAPRLGQHIEEILLDHGYDWDDIIALKDKKVIL